MPVYSDLTYQISSTDRRRRPNPRVISNTVLRGPSGLPSFRNHTALFTYFGKFTYSASDGYRTLDVVTVLSRFSFVIEPWFTQNINTKETNI